jgi:valyl-tRNA synthetase
MERYRINDAAKQLYDVIWHDFCDWYIELIKERLYAPDEKLRRVTLARALHVFDALMRLLHPFMPFVTEEIWHKLEPGRDDRSIMNEQLPPCDEAAIDAVVVEDMTFLQALVEGVRTVRGEMNVPPARECTVVVNCHSERHATAIRENTHFLQRLARISEVEVGADLPRPRLSGSLVIGGEDVYIPLEGLIDVALERSRIEKEIARVEGLLKSIVSKLGNEKFVANAPDDVVAREREKEHNFRTTLGKLQANLAGLAADA